MVLTRGLQRFLDYYFCIAIHYILSIMFTKLTLSCLRAQICAGVLVSPGGWAQEHPFLGFAQGAVVRGGRGRQHAARGADGRRHE